MFTSSVRTKTWFTSLSLPTYISLFLSLSLVSEHWSNWTMMITVYDRCLNPSPESPRGLTFTWWGCYGLCLWHKPTELANSFLFCSCTYFCLYGPFNCISFHKSSRQLSVLSLCSYGLISVLLVLSTVFLFMKVSFSPDVIPSGWLGSKHQLTN